LFLLDTSPLSAGVKASQATPYGAAMHTPAGADATQSPTPGT
jgi:hypothetical protein